MTRGVAVCVVVGILVLAGCSTRRIVECDVYLTTIDRLSRCSELPEQARGQLAASAREMRDALTLLDDAGGAGGPAEQVGAIRETCRSQNRVIVAEYAKRMPACLH